MVKGIQFWAASYCRSTLSFYEGIGIAYNVPIRICVVSSNNSNRSDLGWDDSEFTHLDIVSIGGVSIKAFALLEEKLGWHQVFGAYQSNALFQQTILRAQELGIAVGVCSEAPLNMLEPGTRRFAKALYLRHVVPFKVKPYLAATDFVINLSGSASRSFLRLGCSPKKIVPCGYFPPPLYGTSFKQRDAHPGSDFHILCTGGMSWHRGQDVLLNALKLLKSWGVSCRVTMTQTGPLERVLKQNAKKSDLPVDFVGMLPMPDLVALLEQCSCYVATGREEPWGIRVNDALHCGAPILVSRGMGACQLVDEFGCGLSYNADDYVDLAWKLRKLILDSKCYFKLSSRVSEASVQSMPHVVAGKIAKVIQQDFDGWAKETK
jgi:glycosyltransferase involved in cell wall biosynthesis